MAVKVPLEVPSAWIVRVPLPIVGVPERSEYAPVFATFAKVISEADEVLIVPPFYATPALSVTIFELTEAIVAEPSENAG